MSNIASKIYFIVVRHEIIFTLVSWREALSNEDVIFEQALATLVVQRSFSEPYNAAYTDNSNNFFIPFLLLVTCPSTFRFNHELDVSWVKINTRGVAIAKRIMYLKIEDENASPTDEVTEYVDCFNFWADTRGTSEENAIKGKRNLPQHLKGLSNSRNSISTSATRQAHPV